MKGFTGKQPTKMITNRNKESLERRSTYKRPGIVELTQNSLKRRKGNPTAFPSVEIIDLTSDGDNDCDYKNTPSTPPPIRPTTFQTLPRRTRLYGEHSYNQHEPLETAIRETQLQRSSTSNPIVTPPQQQQLPIPQPEDIPFSTTKLLQRAASTLKTLMHSIDSDREALRQQWHLDRRLQLQAVSEHLKDFNAYVSEAEAKMRDAVVVLEERVYPCLEGIACE